MSLYRSLHGYFAYGIFLPAFSFGIAFAGEADNWRENHPDWLWCDDFESSDTSLSHRYQDVSASGLSIVKHDAFDGTQCLQQHYIQGQVDAGWIIRGSDSFPDHLFMRWYHRFESGFQGYPPKMARVRYRNRTTWISTFQVHCWTETDGVVALDVAASNSTQANSAGWLSIARSNFTFAQPGNIGRWTCFEMEVLLNTPGKTDGLYRLWADDTLLEERTNVDLRGNTSEKLNEAVLDCYWNGGSPKAQNRYYDNFVISTKKIGRYVTSGIIQRNGEKPATKNQKARGASIRILRHGPSRFVDFIVTSPPANVGLFLYDLNGKKIHTISEQSSTTGTRRISWDGAMSGRDFHPGSEYIVVVTVNWKATYKAFFIF
jgi:hypothetical protein